MALLSTELKWTERKYLNTHTTSEKEMCAVRLLFSTLLKDLKDSHFLNGFLSEKYWCHVHRREKTKLLTAALIENCTSSLLQKTLTMMPNIQMHLLQKGDVSFKETQIAFWRISLSIKEKESNMAMILPLNVVARLALYSI